MELNETLIITFLLVVIIILIFSKISISLGNLGNDNNTVDLQSQQNQYQKQYQKQNQYQNITLAPTYNDNMNDLLSNDVKKQLDTLENQFYFNDCRI
jgi:hypothetical protein